MPIKIIKREVWEIEFGGEKMHILALPNETQNEMLERIGIMMDPAKMVYLPKDLMHSFYEELAASSMPTGYNLYQAYGVNPTTAILPKEIV